MLKTPNERFLDKVIKGNNPNDCWIWTACKAHGYGLFSYGQVNGKYKHVSAHRFSYEMHIGKISNGLYVCHRCDNPACVRPDHLFLGTQTDNLRDASEKGRVASGANSRFAKLTVEKVLEIRARHHAGETQAELGRAFHVTKENIGQIVRGRTWRNVKGVSTIT